MFTRGDHGGNHLGVVTDISGLDKPTMQLISKELGFSETIFVNAVDGETPFVRIFTPAMELPFAGHPLVGAAWMLSEMGDRRGSSMTCGVGEIRYRSTDGLTWVDTPLVTDVAIASDGPGIAAEVGLPAPVGAWWAMMPLPYLVLDLGSADAVTGAAPDIPALSAAGAPMTYIIGAEGEDLRVRFFASDAGVPEDPATGSAASALAAVRTFDGEANGSVTIYQGAEIGHPSTIRLDWAPGRASLGGSVRQDETRTLDR